MSTPNINLEHDVIVIDRKFLMSNHIHNPEISPPIRLNGRAFIICTYGELSYSVNYKTYSLTQGSMLAVNNLHIIDDARTGSNCEVMGVIISQGFAMSITRDAPVVKKTIPNIKSLPEPVIKLKDDEMRLLTEIIVRIKNCQKKTDHAFQSVILKNETSNFLMEVLNIYLQRSSVETKKDKKESRKDEIFHTFMTLLIKHFREQHEVAYYATALSMTPDNFSRTVIAVSGKSPIQWINDMLVAEAKTLLRNPDASVNQVADELHFGDQSSFGKFFKKHTGMTPMEYKKMR